MKRKDDPTQYTQVVFTPEKLKRFKAAFGDATKKAVAEGKVVKDEVMDFEGHPFVMSFAAYLIQYLDKKFES